MEVLTKKNKQKTGKQRAQYFYPHLRQRKAQPLCNLFRETPAKRSQGGWDLASVEPQGSVVEALNPSRLYTRVYSELDGFQDVWVLMQCTPALKGPMAQKDFPDTSVFTKESVGHFVVVNQTDSQPGRYQGHSRFIGRKTAIVLLAENRDTGGSLEPSHLPP